jgi:hypothetical protein
LDEAKDARGGAVIASGNTAKLLQQAHHALDAIALGVSNLTRRPGLFAVGFPCDDRMRALQIGNRPATPLTSSAFSTSLRA